MSDQGFFLFATLDDVEYLVVGWTDYNVPRLIRLDEPTEAQSRVPKRTDSVVTYRLNQWTPPPVQAEPVERLPATA